jgi:hypothetical protein
MITGFNTDVRCGDKVFHVQTEDKGVTNPLIESLIYLKGAILDAHRTNYKEFLQSAAFNESMLQRILEFQHRQIVSCIRKGKFQKGMTLEAYVEGRFVFKLSELKNFIPAEASRNSESTVGTTGDDAKREPGSDVITPAPVISSRPTPRLESGIQAVLHPPLTNPSNRIELAVDVTEAADVMAEQGIEICVEGSKEFTGGSHVDLSLFVQSRQGHLRLENVQVIIKIIGTTFSPRLYAGKTDRSGNLRMNFNLPPYSAGSAALIIQASTALGNDEIKYLIRRA